MTWGKSRVVRAVCLGALAFASSGAVAQQACVPSPLFSGNVVLDTGARSIVARLSRQKDQSPFAKGVAAAQAMRSSTKKRAATVLEQRAHGAPLSLITDLFAAFGARCDADSKTESGDPR